MGALSTIGQLRRVSVPINCRKQLVWELRPNEWESSARRLHPLSQRWVVEV